MPVLDPLTIGMLAILAVLVFFMFRNSRKRKAQQQELQTKMVPGATVMTNFGLFGTLESVDEVSNEAKLEIAPGTVITVHRQTLAKVVDPVAEGEPRSVEEAMAIADREQAEREAAANAEVDATLAEPEFGERVGAGDDEPVTDDAPGKPARAPRKTAAQKAAEKADAETTSAEKTTD